MPHHRIASIASIVCLSLGSAAHAVITYGDGVTPGRNTSAPTGAKLNTGFQFEGETGAYTGTPISPKQFLTAAHTGAGVGSFLYNGVTYTGVTRTLDPGSDLAIVTIAETFPTYAPLWTRSDEVGRDLMVYGRGVPADPSKPVTGAHPAGWEWLSTGAQPITWGSNNVTGTLSFHGAPLMEFDFNPPSFGGVGADEGVVSGNDSGGGVFIQDPADGVWKLAGINYGADFTFSKTDGGAVINAAIYDERGLYSVDTSTSPATYTLVPDGADPVSEGSYATRVSQRMSWINTIVPEPTSLVVLCGAGLTLLRRRR